MEFVESPIFTKEIAKLLPDDSYHKLQIVLCSRPDAGDLIRGSGGLRKMRWVVPGRGKRGGLRVIYYWDTPAQILMLFPYVKNKQEDLTPEQLRKLSEQVKEWLA